MAWLSDARIDRARVLLETTTEPIENIGHLTGLGASASVSPAATVQTTRERTTRCHHKHEVSVVIGAQPT